MKLTLPICLLMTLSIVLGACKQQEILVPESTKDLSGEWRIVKAVRNDVDITELADFSKFRLKFTADQYSIENPLPFLVTKNGSYSMDDPKYPFRITFTQTGGSGPVSSSFTYPVVNGRRNMNFSFSPGCTANTYVYTLEKVNP